jgi:hypothetical protein
MPQNPRKGNMCTAFWPGKPNQPRQQCTRNKTDGSDLCVLHTEEKKEDDRMAPIYAGMRKAQQEEKQKTDYSQGFSDGINECNRILCCPTCGTRLLCDRNSYTMAESKLDQMFFQYRLSSEKKSAMEAGRYDGAYAYTVERMKLQCHHPPVEDSDDTDVCSCSDQET